MLSKPPVLISIQPNDNMVYMTQMCMEDGCVENAKIKLSCHNLSGEVDTILCYEHFKFNKQMYEMSINMLIIDLTKNSTVEYVIIANDINNERVN